MNSTLTLTQEWDKTFPQNEAVDHCKVTFHNRFGIELAADLYKPKGAQGPLRRRGRERPVRRREGAVLRPVRAGARRARLSDRRL